MTTVFLFHTVKTNRHDEGDSPPPTRAARAPFASTTCAPSVPHGSVGGVHEGLRGAPASHPACTSRPFSSDVPHATRNRLRHPTSPIMSRTHGPHEVRRAVLAGRVTRVDRLWLGEHPHVLGARVVSRSEGSAPRRALHAPARACTAGATSAGKGGTSYTLPAPKFSFLEFCPPFRYSPLTIESLYRPLFKRRATFWVHKQRTTVGCMDQALSEQIMRRALKRCTEAGTDSSL